MIIIDKKAKVVLIIVMLIPFLFWMISLVNCEVLTLFHANEFVNKEIETNLLLPADRIKVLEYSSNMARVYYINKYNGNVLTFERKDCKWERSEWKTIWSKSGSASGVIWPYWWHFIYGGL